MYPVIQKWKITLISSIYPYIEAREEDEEEEAFVIFITL
jgi:hypothetical protein